MSTRSMAVAGASVGLLLLLLLLYLFVLAPSSAEPATGDSVADLPTQSGASESRRPIVTNEGGALSSENDEKSISTIDVPTTLGLIFMQFHEDPPWNLYRRADATAKPYVYKVLTGRGSQADKSRAIMILGYIGNGEDAVKLEESLRADYSGLLSPHAASSVIATFRALGIMARRKVPEAIQILERMTTFAYWKNPKFQWFPDTLPGRPVFEDTTMAWVMLGYALSESKSLEGKSKSLVAQVKDPNRRKNVMFYTGPERLRTFAKEFRDVEELPISRDLLAQLPRFFNGDLDHPGPRVKVATVRVLAPDPENTIKAGRVIKKTEKDSELSDEFIATLFNEAQTAFGKIAERMRNGDVTRVTDSLLDNEKVLDPRTITRRPDEYIDGLKVQQALFQQAEKIDTTFGDPIVERYTETDELGKLQKEVVTIYFEWKGTDVLRRTLFPKSVHGRTILGNRTLAVLMKRIDGKWYWNPFSW